MHSELIEELTRFALLNNMTFNFRLDKEMNVYEFRFANREKTWTFVYHISAEELMFYNGPASLLVNQIIDKLKEAWELKGRKKIQWLS